ncbi:MAG: hypothetical protein L0H83_11925, partial [Salinisphaera sp.]|nr:hypothetical protein [Salinisphaera sp.]
MLRVAGESFSPEAFLEESSFKPVRVFATGFNLMVSDRDGDDLSGQIEDAFAFLRTHASEVSRLVSFKGVEGVSLDFGVWQQDRPAQSFIF